MGIIALVNDIAKGAVGRLVGYDTSSKYFLQTTFIRRVFISDYDEFLSLIEKFRNHNSWKMKLGSITLSERPPYELDNTILPDMLKIACEDVFDVEDLIILWNPFKFLNQFDNFKIPKWSESISFTQGICF